MLPSLITHIHTTHTQGSNVTFPNYTHTHTKHHHFLHPYILPISFVCAHSEPENRNVRLSLSGFQGILSML